MTSLPAKARDGFAAAFGYQPAGVWSAPGRVNLIGEHTDYNEGFAAPFGIDRRTFAALAPRADGLARVSSSTVSSSTVSSSTGASSRGSSGSGPSSAEAAAGEYALSDLAPAAVRGWAAYPLGVAWALGQVGPDLDGSDLDGSDLDGPALTRPKLSALPGFDVHFVSDVPVGAGLSSSAALECALAVALNDAWQLGFDRARLVKATHLAENDFVGAPTGILDQSAALLSREGAAIFLDCRDGSTAPVDLRLDEFGLTVLVIDTKVNHEHVSGGYAARRASCERAARTLGVRALRDVTVPRLLAARGQLDDETYRRARHVITEDQRVLDTVQALRAEGPAAIGGLLSASHRSMRDDFEISTPELDLAVDTCLDRGALGARMTGGGFGGSAIALTPAGIVHDVSHAVIAAFRERGYRAPDTFTVHPSQGARRDQ